MRRLLILPLLVLAAVPAVADARKLKCTLEDSGRYGCELGVPARSELILSRTTGDERFCVDAGGFIAESSEPGRIQQAKHAGTPRVGVTYRLRALYGDEDERSLGTVKVTRRSLILRSTVTWPWSISWTWDCR
jgi:hypothetical protein